LQRRQFLKLSVLAPVASSSLMAGCTVSQVVRSVNTSHKIINGQYTSAIADQIPGTSIPVADILLRKGFKHFLDEVTKNWNDNKVPTQDTYVKYTEHYKSRAIINFNTGQIQVETVVETQINKALKKAIVQTLLTPEDPSAIDLYSAEEPKVGKQPFLVDLVQDQDNQPIRYQWRAARYADYLLKNNFRQYSLKGKKRFAVEFQMVPDYKVRQGKHYNYLVSKNAQRFGLETSLIYGIIETESSFNPFAVSSAQAYGLMQVVPTTAGRDVYRFLNQKEGTPTKVQLFSPATNIEYGSAYLHILFNRYLNKVKDRQSREYCVIAAYNTGSSNVLRSFSNDTDSAFRKINRLSPEQVYQHLRKKLSTQEARNYLAKVVKNKQRYYSV